MRGSSVGSLCEGCWAHDATEEDRKLSPVVMAHCLPNQGESP